MIFYSESLSESLSESSSESESESGSVSESSSVLINLYYVISILYYIISIFAFFQINLWKIFLIHFHNRTNSNASNTSINHIFF